MANRGAISVQKVFSSYVILIPILQYYNSPIPAFNLATLLALFFGIFFFVLGFREKKTISGKAFLMPAWLYFLFISVNVVLTGILYDYPLDWTNSKAYVRLLVLFFSLVVLGHNYFDLRYAIKSLEKVLVVAAAAIIINIVLYVSVHVSFKPILRAFLSEDTIKVGTSMRSGGLYMEPAHYSQSAMLYLICYLFSKKIRLSLNKTCFWIIIMGIVCSTSGQGYAMLAFLYFILVITAAWSGRLKKRILALCSVLFAAMLVVILYQFSFVQFAVSRIIDDEGNLGGSALAGRTWTNYKFFLLSEKQQLFGVGFGHLKQITGGYVNSLFSYLMQCGYLSISVFVIMVVYYFCKCDVEIKVYLVFFTSMFFFSGIASTMMIMFHFLLYSSGARMRYSGISSVHKAS